MCCSIFKDTGRADVVARYIESKRYNGTAVVIGMDIGADVAFLSYVCGFNRVVAVEGLGGDRVDVPKGASENGKITTPIALVMAVVSNRPEVFLNVHTASNPPNYFVSEVPLSSDSVRVSTRTLDAICSCEDRIDLIKIDVDGHELEILKSGLETLRRHSPDICVKVFLDYTEHISQLLEKLGYVQVEMMESSIAYFSRVGWIMMAVFRVLTAMPFCISSRSVWRWRRVAGRITDTKRRLRSILMGLNG